MIGGSRASYESVGAGEGSSRGSSFRRALDILDTPKSSVHNNSINNEKQAQAWWESLARARKAIDALCGVIPIAESEAELLKESERPARALLDSTEVAREVRRALASLTSGTASDPLCRWLYDTYTSEDRELQLVVLRFVPLLSGIYLCRLVSALVTEPLAGFEAVLLALYSSEAKARGGRPLVVQIPDLSQPSLYHSPRHASPSPRSDTYGQLCAALEPQATIKSTKRAGIVGVLLDLFYRKIALMPASAKLELCRYAYAWAGQDCPCVHSLDQGSEHSVWNCHNQDLGIPDFGNEVVGRQQFLQNGKDVVVGMTGISSGVLGDECLVQNGKIGVIGMPNIRSEHIGMQKFGPSELPGMSYKKDAVVGMDNSVLNGKNEGVGVYNYAQNDITGALVSDNERNAVVDMGSCLQNGMVENAYLDGNSFASNNNVSGIENVHVNPLSGSSKNESAGEHAEAAREELRNLTLEDAESTSNLFAMQQESMQNSEFVECSGDVGAFEIDSKEQVNYGVDDGNVAPHGTRIPLPWELMRPLLRILGHCLFGPRNSPEVRDAAAIATRCLFARACHDLVPEAILATRSLVRLDVSARQTPPTPAGAFSGTESVCSAGSNVTTPSRAKKPEVLLASK